MPALDVERTRKIAELRIHVEQLLAVEDILNKTFANTMFDLVSGVSVYLTNFDVPLIQ